MHKTIKLDDVARLAGVSPKTVSRVVNGEAHVSKDKQAAVEKAIAALGYKPNLAARSLASARSFLVGLVTPPIEHFYSYFHGLHSSGVRACRQRGLHLIVEEADLEHPKWCETLENSLRQMRYDGLILTHPANKNRRLLALLERLKIRYVRVGPVGEAGISDSVVPDEAGGMRMIAEHLLSLGHRHIAIGYVEARRRNVLRDALLACGANAKQLQFLPLVMHETPLNAGRQLAASMLALRRRPTAIFTYADDPAAGLMGYLRQQGLSIPADVSVVGYDDGEVAQAVWPPLTTIREPLDQMVQTAVSLLLEPANDGKPRRVVCPVKLIVRDSTGPAPGGK